MREIKLSQGKVALVDDEDFESLNTHKWFALKIRNTFYAVRSRWVNGKQQSPVLMHREILCLIDPKVKTDHKDHNGLNNQRENIRPCTNQENMRNCSRRKSNTSGYKGVCYHKRDKAWRAQIRTIDGKYKTIGSFSSPLEAAIAYNKSAIIHHGKFAHLNNLDSLKGGE